MTVELKKEFSVRAITSIRRYFEENFDDEIGNLQAAALLDFFLKEIGPSVYNQAVADAQARMTMRIAELDVDCYEEEFTFWRDRKRR